MFSLLDENNTDKEIYFPEEIHLFCFMGFAVVRFGR